MISLRKFIAAHCKGCARAVTCGSQDVLDEQGNPVLLEGTENVQQTDVLTGRCDGCGTVAEVTPYTPVPFTGQPVDPRAPLMAAHVGPFGSVPTADALRPQVPTGLTTAAPSTVPGVGDSAPPVPAQAGPDEAIAPQQTAQAQNDARAQYEDPAYAPVGETA